MINLSSIFFILCFFQSWLFASEERLRTFSNSSGVTDTSASLSSVDIQEEISNSPHFELRIKENFPYTFLSGLKYRRWEYSRRQLLQGPFIHTEYPPYELLLKTTRPEYYEAAVQSSYQQGWILDTNEEAWEEEQILEKERAHPDLISIISGIEEFAPLAPKTQENLQKRKFQGWQEKRDHENIQIIIIINFFLFNKTFSHNETDGFIKDAVKTERLPEKREDILKLWDNQKSIDDILAKMWMFVVEGEDDESAPPQYTEQLLLQEIRNRDLEEETDLQVQLTLMQLKQEQYLESVVFARQQRRVERLTAISTAADHVMIHEPDNKEAVCSFLWDGSINKLTELQQKKSMPLQRKKEKKTTLRVTFDDTTARLDYHKKDPTDIMNFKGFFLLPTKERTSVPKTRTRRAATGDINSAWGSKSPCFQPTGTPLKKSPSMSFSNLIKCQESCGASENGSGV